MTGKHLHTIEYQAEKEYRNIRRFLHERHYPEGILAGLKSCSYSLQINGRPAKLVDPVAVGDYIEVTIAEDRTSSAQIVPQEGKLDIVFEDEHLLVINKNHHMAIHPSLNHKEMSLANVVRFHALSRQEDYPFRCINRLDRDTTGLVIIAKHRLAAAILSEDIAGRRIHRGYTAVCMGRFEKKEGIIDVPIGRVEGAAVLRKVDPVHGQRAVTHFRVLEESEANTLVSLVLETGRCHQIRIHMGYIGHPLPADYLYCREYSLYDTIPLHAGRISFTHPVTGAEMSLSTEAPFTLL